MPTYPYLCEACGTRFSSHLSYEEYGKTKVRCTQCHSPKVRRRISRVRTSRSEEGLLDSLADPAALAGLEDDPKAMGQMMRQLSNETGEDLGPEFDEVVNRLEAGQSPESIEKDMPDLGDSMGG